MIVSVTAAAGKTQVTYGACTMLVDPDGKIDVPDYVAKTLCTMPGFSTTPALTQTAAQLLNAGPAEDNWEATYLLRAWNKPVTGNPADDYNAAKALMTASGEPTVSAS